MDDILHSEEFESGMPLICSACWFIQKLEERGQGSTSGFRVWALDLPNHGFPPPGRRIGEAMAMDLLR